MFKKCVAILWSILLVGGAVCAQELSHLVFTDQDILYDAFLSGEIDYFQYQQLLDISNNTLSPQTYFLYDLIPGLGYFGDTASVQSNNLEIEQAAIVNTEQTTPDCFNGSLRQRYYQTMEEDAAIKRNTRISAGYKTAIQFHLRYQREYSGRERLITRSIQYQKNHLSATIGNFTNRFGLGTIVGYRGKLLDYADQLTTESLLYPDYGGYNGISFEYRKRKNSSTIMYSYNKDSSFSVQTTSGTLSRQFNKITVTGITAFNKVTNRTTAEYDNMYSAAISTKYLYTKGYLATELAFEHNKSTIANAVVWEGRHKLDQALIKFAGWRYGSEFTGLSSGSKTTPVYHTNQLLSSEFTYSDKRAGQTGGLIKTEIDLTEKSRLSNGLIAAFYNNKNVRLEYSVRYEYSISADIYIAGYFLSKKRELSSGTKIKRVSQVELKYRHESLYFRTNVSYISNTGENDYLAWFLSGRTDWSVIGRTEFWINIRDINHHTGQIDGYYMYVKEQLLLLNSLTADIKLSHRYSRYTDNEHTSTIMIGFNALL